MVSVQKNPVEMKGVSVQAMHGSRGDASWAAPLLAVACDAEARPGYRSMKAHEYVDQDATLRAKVQLLAQMIRESKECCAYTGAGISTGAGIGDYASKAGNSLAMAAKPKIGSALDAQPTYSHHVLAALYHAGFLKHWVQQNHDGLPQKAGFPPEALNEIHGAWFDPSNPVVPMSGSLRADLFEWLSEWEQRADLTLALGTSLCGMSADCMVHAVSQNASQGAAIGAVIVSLQQTQYDDVCSLRIFARIDDVMRLLAKELGLAVQSAKRYTPTVPRSSVVSDGVYTVPYAKNGKKSETTTCVWNLSTNAKVKVTDGPGKGFTGTVLGKNSDGHFRIQLPTIREGSKDHGKGAVVYLLGSWWVQSATAGLCPRLPVVNC